MDLLSSILNQDKYVLATITEHWRQKEVLDLMRSHGLRNVFNEPSRITTTSSTCIDNMFVPEHFEEYEAKTDDLHVADHCAQILSMPMKTLTRDVGYYYKRIARKIELPSRKPFRK
ncbi:hypothetical protein HHI36_010179 [Cryptolaemus montrouzieri]|uniref:Uncharacterized protein n=1 Tax=Cryptolaemus montrouzieri TaxID=559131 RepID=A0ABD2MI66_9CUCU